MIKAYEAHSLTTDKLNEKVLDEIENIEEEINDAILNCKYNCTVNKLSKEAEQLLKELGYEINKYTDYFKENNEILISWDRGNK